MKKIAQVTLIGVLLLFAFAIPALATGLDEKAAKAEEESIVIGQVPPDFTLTDMDGNEFTLSEMAGEKAVVIDFWATWCGWCLRGFPNLVEFNEMYGDEVEVVGVGVWMDMEVEPDESSRTVSDEDLANFIEEHNLNFRLLMNWESNLTEEYFITGIPLTVIVDKNGNVAAIYSGYHETLKDDLVGLLDLEE